MTRKKFVPVKYKCPKCGDEIASKWPGDFVVCTCGECFVDQTEYYIRVGGFPEEVKEDDKE